MQMSILNVSSSIRIHEQWCHILVAAVCFQAGDVGFERFVTNVSLTQVYSFSKLVGTIIT